MAQPPEDTTALFQTLELEDWWMPLPAPTSGLPAGCVFRPKSRCLIDHYLIPRVLDGRASDVPDSIAEGVDLYAVRPAALPFPARNRDRHHQVWAYFFTTTRPAAAAASGGSSSSAGSSDRDYVREVATGGCWRRYGGEKEYVGDDGNVYAFRRRFAFCEAGDDGGVVTEWRMTELRLNEAAPAFRGVEFHPGARDLVVCRVDNEVIRADEELEQQPQFHYYISDDEDDGNGAIVIAAGGFVSAPAAAAA